MTKNMKAILSKVIEKYQFSPKEKIELDNNIKRFIKELQSEIRKLKIKAVVMLGGSAAKNTFLKDDFDCDIFVRFDYKTYLEKEKKIGLILGNILKKYSPVIMHGSRDYYHIFKDNIKYEIVPVLNVKDPKKAVNVTDMSPLHVQWVVKNMTKQLRDEIILTKVFFKENQLYGAESYINGFSGHVVDILLIKYKSFLNLLKESRKWQPYIVIDIEKHNTAKWLNESKISPLILIDPILPSRNAAAAVNLEKFNLFKKTALEFLQNPSSDFFIKKTYSVDALQEELKQKHPKKKVFLLEVTPLEGKEDIILTKILKAFEHIKNEAKLFDFLLIDSNIDFTNKQKILFSFVIENEKLSTKKLIKGPPLQFEEGCIKFKQKHTTAFIKNKQFFAFEEREFIDFISFLNNIRSEDYVKERVEKITLYLTK